MEKLLLCFGPVGIFTSDISQWNPSGVTSYPNQSSFVIFWSPHANYGTGLPNIPRLPPFNHYLPSLKIVSHLIGRHVDWAFEIETSSLNN
jgi:hypothetical protein